jgi:hypothetical protein
MAFKKSWIKIYGHGYDKPLINRKNIDAWRQNRRQALINIVVA